MSEHPANRWIAPAAHLFAAGLLLLPWVFVQSSFTTMTGTFSGVEVLTRAPVGLVLVLVLGIAVVSAAALAPVRAGWQAGVAALALAEAAALVGTGLSAQLLVNTTWLWPSKLATATLVLVGVHAAGRAVLLWRR